MNLPPIKQAGVCLHLTSLPGHYGIGQLGAAAREFIDALVAMNLGVWQFLPIGPTAFGDSPYQPLSTFAGNELLIDVEDLVDKGLVSSQAAARLADLPVASVDYGRLIPLKQKLLAEAAVNFERSADADTVAQFEQFLADHDQVWLHDYALFRTLKDYHNQLSWVEWGPEFVRRDRGALADFEHRHEKYILRTKVLQFLFDRQWAAMRRYAGERGVTLFGDMPIYIAFDSADAWAHPELLLTNSLGKPDYVAGVPPDYFSADGQLWGNPLYDWDYHASHDFAWWVARLRHAHRYTDLVRIDHFRAFESYWAIPAGATTAKDGEWRPGPGDAIFTAVRAALGELPIVAEDLGIITPEVDLLRERQRIPGMRVLQFDIVAPEFDLASIEENSVCYTGTHDNDTVVGWFGGSPGDQRTAAEIAAQQKLILERTHGQPQSIHNDLIRLTFSSDARLAVAPMQDFLGLGSAARLNTPGTSANNWRWRLQAGQLDLDRIDSVAEMVLDAGRGRAAGAHANDFSPVLSPADPDS
jgi:4-alpha-glucanotransferase